LAFEAESDPTNNDQEQTWPTAEELEKAQAEQNQIKKRVPKGTSEYQAAWILSDDEEEYKNSDAEQNVILHLCVNSFLIEFLFRILKMMMMMMINKR
jgi:hypothetical protein